MRTVVAAIALLAAWSAQAQLTSVTLAWDPSPQPDTIGYHLYSGTTSGVYTQTIDVGNVTEAVVSNLVTGQTYYFTVTGYNSALVETPPSNEISAVAGATPTPTPTPSPTPGATPTPTGSPTQAPASPTNLQATAISSKQINLSWTDNSNNENGFKVERSTDGVTFTQVGTVGANITSCGSTSLNPSTKYYYRVRAYNSAGNSGYSNVANATTMATSSPTPTPTPSSTPGQMPTSPTNLQADAVSTTKITLSWTDNSNTQTGFKIDGSTNGTTFVQIAKVGASARTYSSTGLSPSTKYYYRVRAYNLKGNSSYSNTANATTMGASAQPTPSPTAAPATAPTITVSASPISVHEGSTAVFTFTASSANPNAPITVNYFMAGKAVYGQHYNLSGTWGQVTIPAGATSATVTLTAPVTNLTTKSEKAILVLQKSSNYKLKSLHKKATVTIVNTYP